MEDGLERWVRDDSLVESTRLCDILDYNKVELILAILGMSCLDLVCLLLASDSANNGVTRYLSACVVLEQDPTGKNTLP